MYPEHDAMVRDERAYEVIALRALGAGRTAALDEAFDLQRTSLRQTFEDRHRRLLAMTALMKETLRDLRNRGWDTHAQLWNIGIHVNLATHDLSVLVWQLGAERDIWARKLAARHVVLQMFEITENLVRQLGSRIREALRALEVLDRFEDDLRVALAPLHDFRRVRATEFNCLRNVAAAHRDPDSLRLLEAIENLDIGDTLSLGSELSQILNDLGPALQRIIVDTSRIAPPESAR